MPDIPSTQERLDAKKEAMEAGIYLRPDVAPCDATIQRVRQLAELLSSGKSDVSVRKYIVKEYDIKDDRAIDGYMAAAYRYITPTDWNEEKDRVVSKNIKTLEKIIEKCMDKENYKTAKEAIDSLNKVFGISGQNSVTIAKNKDGEEMINISFE